MTPPTKAALLPVEQVDRDAAAPIFEAYGAGNYAALCRKGSHLVDGLLVVQQMACHRLNTRPALPDDVGAVVEQSAAWVKLLRDHSAKTPEGLRLDPGALLALTTLIESLSADREGVEAAVLAEREACAKVADDWLATDFDESANTMAGNIAAAIRERGGR